MMRLTTKELAPSLWPQVEALFGKTGACGGCWCQAWRIEKGERWKEVKGAVAKERLRKSILDGTTRAIIAFDGETPIGWCTFGPRDSFPRLNRARSLQCNDSSRVWSLPCFFVARGYRGRGVAKTMLKHALEVMRKGGVEIAEGYPSKPNKDGRYIAAFSWTGTISLFAKAGFATAGNAKGSKRRVRKRLNPHNYSINLDAKFGFLKLIDIPGLIAECKEQWYNQTLCRVNDCVVRLGVVQGDFHWHKHDEEDEFFFVIRGKFVIDLEGKTVVVEPHQGYAVPRGVAHRTRAPERTVVLMVERSSVKPTGD